MLTNPELRIQLNSTFEVSAQDTQRQLEDFEQRVNSVTHRQRIAAVREHFYHEMISFDLDQLMATFIDDPGPSGTIYDLRYGWQAIREQYADLMPARMKRGSTFDILHLLVDDDMVFLEMTGIYTLDYISEVWNEDLPRDRPAVATKRWAVRFLFQGDRLYDEIAYFDGAFSANDLAFLDDERVSVE
jgi:hypothetical protein